MLTERILYQQELIRCKEQFNLIKLHNERGYMMKYTTFSANVENIMSSISREKHETLFKELLLQEVFTSFDQRCLTTVDIVTTSGRHEFLCRANEPFIYCTYHLGSYRSVTSILFRKGISFVLLLGSNLYQTQGKLITEHLEALRHKHGLTNTFRLLDAGNPTAVLALMREVKAGHSIITYVDGSLETGPQVGEEDQFLSVQFGSKRVLTRKGMGYLSHVTGVPIIPVITYRRQDLTSVIHIHDPIRPSKNSDRDVFCQEAMQRLFDHLWQRVQRNPSQWEGWNFIQLFFQPEDQPQRKAINCLPEKPTFNGDRYSICDLETAPILFDRRTYQVYEITDDLRDLLLDVQDVDSVGELLGKEMYDELCEMDVLH